MLRPLFAAQFSENCLLCFTTMEGEHRSSLSEEEDGAVELSSKPSNEVDCREEYEVMSEVHLGCPPHFCGPYVSHFTFPSPPEFDAEGRRHVEGTSNCQDINFDEDGDLILTRHNKSSNNGRVTIQHSITSTIPSVGLQVWRAELVLADFVLHNLFTSKAFDKIVALELGAGTGLLGILLASVAQTVFLTDHGNDILDNCAVNVHLNSHIHENHQTSVYVRELDWNNPWPPSLSPNRCKYSWSPSEIEEVENASLLLAADVIYSDDLTDAFFHTLKNIMSCGCKKVLYLALEKRYNFSIDDLDVVANGYAHFRSYLRVRDENGTFPCFVGKEIDVADIPQYVREYNRENNVEIWEIEYLVSSQMC